MADDDRRSAFQRRARQDRRHAGADWDPTRKSDYKGNDGPIVIGDPV